MEVKYILSELQRLVQIAESWEAQREISAIERDMALEKLRKLYETIRFAENISAGDDEIAEPAQNGDSAEALPEADAETNEIVVPMELIEQAPESEQTTPKQTLFEIEEEAERHRHKQRVIMSLYNSEVADTPLTPAAPEKPAEEEKEEIASATARLEMYQSKVAENNDIAEQLRNDTEEEEEMPVFEEVTIDTSPASGAVLGETINPNIQTFGETFTPQRDIASELRSSEPIGDLHCAIGINDKFLMIRDLFNGDAEQYEATIERLNAFDNLDDCIIFITENFTWNANSDGAKLLMNLLERKLA